MEIKNLNNRMINAYKTVAGKPEKAKSGEQPKKAGGENVDKVEFNFDRSISAAKTDIAASIGAEAGAARLEALQVAYEGDSLPVTTGQIAGAIVG